MSNRSNVGVLASPTHDLDELFALSSHVNGTRAKLTVELENGFGNQLFQVAALLALALDRGSEFSIELPDVDRVCYKRPTYWNTALRKLRPFLARPRIVPLADGNCAKGQRPLSKLEGECLLEQVPGSDPWKSNCSVATHFSGEWAGALPTKHQCGVVKLRGYFQNPSFFEKHLALLRHAFIDDGMALAAERRLAALAPPRRPGLRGDCKAVALHYRLGDYDPNGWALSEEYYQSALKELARRQPQACMVCYIFSDDPPRAKQRSASLQGCASRVLISPEEGDVMSFHMMAAADASILADSSFAYWAALLGGPHLKTVFAPQVEGPFAACWSYFLRPPSAVTAAWVLVPAGTQSPQELLATELLSLTPPDDDSTDSVGK